MPRAFASHSTPPGSYASLSLTCRHSDLPGSSSATKAQGLHRLCRTIGARVREERKRRGLTQEKLAELTDLSANYIAHVERASRGVSLDTLVKLAKVFGVSAYKLFMPSRAG